MKLTILFLLAILPFWCFAQYKGGGNDGMSQAQSTIQNALPNIYAGGNNDGHAQSTSTGQNALQDIYKGGSNDGISSTSASGLNALPNIYKGSGNDGNDMSPVTNQNPLPNIYAGGPNDGTALALAPSQNALNGIYKGGANDGTAFSLTSLENQTPSIYTGGIGDGYDIVSQLDQNPLDCVPSVAPTGATGTTSVCSGGSTTLTVTGGSEGTGATTEWFTGSCGGTLVFTGNVFSTGALGTTTIYFVRYRGTCYTTTCATVTVTVPTNTITLNSAAGTDNQTVSINTAINNIKYLTTGATGATFSGLPAGVTGNWAANVVTISGAPTVTGIFNYTVTLTGGCGTITATGTITVNSCITPTITCPGTQTANTANGICSATVSYSVTSTGTPAPAITYAFTGASTGSGSDNGSGSSFNKGVTTVMLTATNTCGTATCTFTVTVTDNQAPAVTCPFSVNQNKNTNSGVCTWISPNTSLNATATNNCAVTSLKYILSGATTGTGTTLNGVTFNKGVTTITWTAMDSASLSSSCSFTLTVIDTIKPTITCPTNISVRVLSGCTATVSSLGTPTTADNCSVASTTNDHASTTYPLGTTSVTWTVIDGSGNTATCTQTVTVTDTIKPTITSPTNISVRVLSGCTATVASLGTPTTGDNCSVASTTNDHASTTYPLGTTSVVWTVTDGSGNTATCTQTVTVTDTIKPTITCPTNISVRVLSGCTATVSSLGTPTTTDNCSVASTSNDHASTTYPLGTTSVTWTVTDGSGNTATCTQTVTVTDTIKPTITCPTNISVKVLSGCTAIVSSLGTPTTADNCSVASTTNDHASTSYPLGTTSVTWTVTDGSGNTATCTQTVTITDTIKPTITCPTNISVRVLSGCTATVSSLGTPTTTDNCSVASTSNDHASTTYPLGTTSVTWTVTDGSGNTATCTQTVTVTDTIKPTITCPTNISTKVLSGCTATVSSLGTPTTADNCSVASTTNDHASNTYPLGTTSVVWTVTDGSGNTATCTQTVTVTDTIKPTITCPTNISAKVLSGCAATVTALGTPTTSDNCSVASVTNDHASTSYPVGTTSVTWTVTDGSGNTATCTQTVTVVDTIKPTITCPSNITVNVLNGCSDTISSLGTPTTVDNCSVASTTNDHPSTTYPLGITNVVWTVTDGSGNTATCTQTVTVIDTIVPTIGSNSPLCTGATLQLTASSPRNGATYSWTGPNGFSSNQQNPNKVITTADAGVYTVTVTTNFGCQKSVSTTVTIDSLICHASSNSPVFNGNTIMLFATSSGSAGPTYAWTGPNGFTSTNQNPTIPNATPVNAGVYTVVVTSASGCTCSSSTIVVIILTANKDAFLRDGAENTNEGANPLLRICASGHNRAIVAFNLTGVSLVGLTSAKLVLTIDSNVDNWGGGAPGTRWVDACRVTNNWIEGNGWNDQGSIRGTGHGVTWDCFDDANIVNASPDGTRWDGGIFDAPRAPGVLHYNGLLGEVSWDVTADMLATGGAPYGWIIKKRNEGLNGRVFYKSKENTDSIPKLVLTYTYGLPKKAASSGIKKEVMQSSDQLIVFPNPAREYFTLQTNNAINESSILTLQDMSGRVIIRNNLQLQEGVTNYSVNIAGISEGMYIVSLQTSTGTKQVRLEINR